MRFVETELPGAYVVHLDLVEDERGFFARSWSPEEFAEHGLSSEIAQCSVSYNHRVGTLRGMHFQVGDDAEVKLVRCTRGAVHDVILDLRPDSPTFGRWIAVELSQENRRMLYVPEGLAHGYQTLVDGTELSYQISRPYAPAAARGVRWDDSAFAIEWPPVAERIISERDRSWPDFVPAAVSA